MANTSEDKAMLLRDSARELTVEEIKEVAGGFGFSEFFHTVGRDIVTSMKGAAPAAAVAGRVPVIGSNLSERVELGAALAGLGFGLVEGIHEGWGR